jgi:ubiquinone/menaquinone biosynthesis C-methylase UbiE
MGTEHFDAAAATWDDNPQRRATTAAIARSIVDAIPIKPQWRVLEYACGTASLGFMLADRVQAVVAADASPGMIEQVRRKIATAPRVPLEPRVLDLSCQDPPPERYELIAMAMGLHHVETPEALLKKLAGMLTPGGYLAIADLCKEDGSFHAPRTVPHNGFEPEELAKAMRTCGLVPESPRVVHHVEKNGRHYPVFLAIARLPD